MDCPHPPSARICYRDRAAPLGREGEEWCDLCGERLMTDAWEYLGDGVYASFDGSYIWLMTHPPDGLQRIALEPPVMAALVAYADKVWAQRAVTDVLDEGAMP